MRISPRFTDDDWKRLSFESEADWEMAIKILTDRIDGRFLKPVEMIEDYEYAGFATMAIDCLLIETLQQFIEGKPKTPRHDGEKYFKRYLAKYFAGDFTEEIAALFYRQIRCGILHQAEVESNSLIRTGSTVPIVQQTSDCKGLMLNRRKFHSQLKDAFGRYLNELRDGTAQELRGNFRRKMDYITRSGRRDS